jgi:RNase P/RNase MRP subunit p29
MPRSDDAAALVAEEELIGLPATVTASAHAPFVGVAGVVVDETARTFRLDVGGREIVVPKVGQRFRFETRRGVVEIDGALLAHDPIERIKKLR